MNFKHGTANNKILQLREHLARNNTMSNPDLLKDEQAVIDFMFSEKGRQASRGREQHNNSVYALHKIKKTRKALTKPPNTIERRGVSSTADRSKDSKFRPPAKEYARSNSKNLLNVASEYIYKFQENARTA